MKAIPTTYRGIDFRSRLEARWAQFFDAIGVCYEFEPEGYETSAGRYLPDFWLPFVRLRGVHLGVFFEVKPASPTVGEASKAIALVCGSGRPVIVPALSPCAGRDESLLEYMPEQTPWGVGCATDDGLTFARCTNCGQANINYHASNEDPCPCGKATFSPHDHILESARQSFQNNVRWEAAAA